MESQLGDFRERMSRQWAKKRPRLEDGDVIDVDAVAQAEEEDSDSAIVLTSPAKRVRVRGAEGAAEKGKEEAAGPGGGSAPSPSAPLPTFVSLDGSGGGAVSGSEPITNTFLEGRPVWVPEKRAHAPYYDYAKATARSGGVEAVAQRAFERTLSREVLDLAQWLAPTAEERAMRSDVLMRVTRLVSETWPRASLVAFGSFAIDLYLPVSDMDFVVMNADSRNPLRQLASRIRSKRMASSMKMIAHARVPIIKYTDYDSGCNVDISFDLEGGPENAYVLNAIMEDERFRHARKIALLIKYFLACRELNEPFNGGLGSYSVMILVISFFQHHPNLCQASDKSERDVLGKIFLRFLKFYGSEFNWMTTGISLLRGGSYFNKADRGDAFLDENEPWKPALEDPRDTSNNIAAPTYATLQVRSAFHNAYLTLVDEKSRQDPRGVLAQVFTVMPGIIEHRRNIALLYKEVKPQNSPSKKKKRDSSNSDARKRGFSSSGSGSKAGGGRHRSNHGGGDGRGKKRSRWRR